MKDISDIARTVEEGFRAQVALKAELLAPIRARFRALDLSHSNVVLELTYDEVGELKGPPSWLPTLAYALKLDVDELGDEMVPATLTVTVRGPGMADWPLELSSLD